MFEMPRDASHYQLRLLSIDIGYGCEKFLGGGSFESQYLFAVPSNEYFSVFGHSKRKRFRFKFPAFIDLAHRVSHLRVMGGRGQCSGAGKNEARKILDAKRAAESHTSDLSSFPLKEVFALDFQDSCCTLCWAFLDWEILPQLCTLHN